MFEFDVYERLRDALKERYTVEREIGRGGMAAVYLAEEHHPRRRVAIKVLMPDVATRILRERFLREVSVASTLTHPHIVPVFAAGEADGLLYYVMPYIEGESLRQRLSRRGALPVQQAAAIAREVAGALHYAHGLGVIHRDIKPENILLTEDHALVADFGIARALGEAGGESLTQAGLAVGTPAYMSPEQAMGGRDVDARTDIYSLGCVLLEALGGRVQPGTSPMGRLSTVGPTVRASGAATVTRAGITAVLKKALAAEPAERYATAAEFRKALANPEVVGSAASVVSLRRRGWRVAVALAGAVAATVVGLALLVPSPSDATTPRRVVVDVFANRSGDPALDHLGPMAADWVTQGLAQTGLIDVVVARGGMARDVVEDEPDRIQTLAGETDAELVVSGSYFVQGNEVQYQARVTDPVEGRVLVALMPVAAALDSPLVGVERLRQRVLGALATLVDDRLAGTATAISQPPSYEAYRAYVDGMTALVRVQQPLAIVHFLRAYDLDPTFYQAAVGAAVAYGTMERWAQADSVARLLEPRRSQLSAFDRANLDWVTAVARGDLLDGLEAIRTVAASAGAEIKVFHALTAGWANRPQEAVDVLRTIDPNAGFVNELFFYWMFLGDLYHMLGDYRAGVSALRDGVRRFPNNPLVVGAAARTFVPLNDVRGIDSLLARLATMPPPIEFGQSLGDLLRVLALDAAVHDHDDLAAALRDRMLTWYQGLSPADTALELHRYGYARALYQVGEWDRAVPMFDALVAATPDSVGYHGYLGSLAARTGDSTRARAISERLETMRRPYGHGAVPFWRARIAALLGDFDAAVAFLWQADGEGYKRTGEEHYNVDLFDMRDHEPFLAWLRPRG